MNNQGYPTWQAQQVTAQQLQIVLVAIPAVISMIFGIRTLVKTIQSDVEESKLKKQEEQYP